MSDKIISTEINNTETSSAPKIDDVIAENTKLKQDLENAIKTQKELETKFSSITSKLDIVVDNTKQTKEKVSLYSGIYSKEK